MKDARTARLGEMTIQTFDDPEQAEDRERERAPMDEAARTLMREHGKQGPSDRDGPRKITLGRREGVRGCGGLEEEEAEEDEDLGPDAGVVGGGVDAEGRECGEDDEDGGPAVVEREGEVHEELVGGVGRLVVLLDDVVDVRHGR